MKHIFLILISSSICFAQNKDLQNIEVSIVSEIPFTYMNDDLLKFKASYEVQQWSMEILKSVLKKIKSEPLSSDPFLVKVIIYNEKKNRFIEVPIEVKEEFVNAFKTENGFKKKYYKFVSSLYEWIIRSI